MINLSILLLSMSMAIIVAAGVFWWARRYWYAQEASGDVAGAHTAPLSNQAIARTSLIFCTLCALLVYLFVGSPQYIFFHKGTNLSPEQVENNTLILERYLARELLDDSVDTQSEDHIRLLYRLAEYYFISQRYLEASQKLGELYRSWPEQEGILRYYLLALILAATSAEGESAQSLYSELRSVAEQSPQAKETLKELLALQLQGNPKEGGSPTTSYAVAIEYSPALSLTPESILFISAHPLGDNAPKMPLLAKKITQKPFPVKVTLSRFDFLSPESNWHDHSELELRVRISQTGSFARGESDVFSTQTVQLNKPVWQVRLPSDTVLESRP